MRIVIHNFGPIKEADIETKRYTVFIGQTSTGKSVAAKLFSIAESLDFLTLKDGEYIKFAKQLLPQYGIDFEFSDNTSIEISRGNASWDIRRNSFKKTGEIESPWNFIITNKFDDNELLSQELVLHLASGHFTLDSFMDSVQDKLKSSFEEKTDLNVDDLPDYQKNVLKVSLIKLFQIIANPVYIPAERILMSLFSNSVFSLLRSQLPIPETILRFGSYYEDARAKLKTLDIDFMSAHVNFSNGMDTIKLDRDSVEIPFSQASSGMLSAIPMWSVIYNSLNAYKRSIIIEEPELNLFPSLQVALIMKMMELFNQSKNSLVVTTHSPYILSVFDNLIYAKDVYDRADDKRKEKVTALVNADAMINFDDITAYSFDDNGIVTYINDAETRSTGAYALDTASNETANVFNELLAIDRSAEGRFQGKNDL